MIRPYHGYQYSYPSSKRMKNTQDQIDKWIIEATSNHNDGWTQQYYRDQLQGTYDRLNDLEFILKDKNGKENK